MKDKKLRPRNKVELEPGVHYKGSFWVNEYGEFTAVPYNKGSRPGGGNYTIVTETDDFSIYESKNLYKVVLKIDKAKLCVGYAMRAFLSAADRLRDYLK